MKEKKIYIASDHGGFLAKSHLIDFLKHRGLPYEDFGTCSDESVDYPEFAAKLAMRVAKEKGRGILICGTGIGVSIVANRFKGVRAALCRNTIEARLSRQHNDSNILCLAGRFDDDHTREEIVKSWLETKFEGGRHQRRVDMFSHLGASSFSKGEKND